VAVSGWRDEEGAPLAALHRIGASLSRGAERRLMSETTWRLVHDVRNLATSGAEWSADQRLRAAGQIRKLALACGAQLDRYLEQTSIATPDTLNFKFEKHQMLGVPVVEVRPELDGVPPEFVGQFDRYDAVRQRYDVVTPDGGITHIVPGEGVRAALEGVKNIPGRRVAGGEAASFLRNPLAVLGESATAAIDEEAFTQARIDAGIRFKRLQLEDGRDPQAFVVRLFDSDGIDADEVRRLPDRRDVQELRDRAATSRQRGRSLFAWGGEDIECGADTDAVIAAADEWLRRAAMATVGIRYAAVFDLSAYSDRVVGFDGAPIAVPYVALKNADKGWLPENIEYGLVPTSRAVGSVSAPKPLTSDQITQLAGAVGEARRTGATCVDVPGFDAPVPVDQAASWIGAFEEDAKTRRAKRDPRPEKNPDGSTMRPILRILHNIENLDYDAKAALPPMPDSPRPALSEGLAGSTTLLPHQGVGLAWMQHRLGQRAAGVTGCLLADDMGLGKTLQALCLIARYLETDPNPRPCLVVAPVSLLVNWQNEIERFFGQFPGRVITVYGDALSGLKATLGEVDPALREAGLKKFLRPGFEQGSGLVLTTYETLRDYEFSFGRVQWGIVVCDEAQKIKTPRALVTRAAKALKSEFKIACTGTPVENSLADLWCLFDFVQPGLLGSLNEFTRVFRRSIETRAEGHESQVERLRGAIDPWVLRRMKQDVANLPPKHEGRDPLADPGCGALPMSDLQKRLYAATVGEFRAALKARDQKSGTRILEILHRLRTICSNPVSAAFDDAERLSVETHLQHSPKLRWLVDRLAAIRAKGEKVIIFTEFREIQRTIQRVVARHFEIHPDIVNGSTSVDPNQEASRQHLIDRFQQQPGFAVIVLSTTAVGFGVNVQAANHVIHFTRPWNPAKEDQATDRAYRIGQTRPVHVYCPTVCGDGFESFDQRIDQLLNDKRSLSRDMLAGAQEIKVEEFESL